MGRGAGGKSLVIATVFVSDIGPDVIVGQQSQQSHRSGHGTVQGRGKLEYSNASVFVLLLQPSEINDFCFTSTFQISGKFLFRPTLIQKHTGKGIVGSIVPAQSSHRDNSKSIWYSRTPPLRQQQSCLYQTMPWTMLTLFSIIVNKKYYVPLNSSWMTFIPFLLNHTFPLISCQTLIYEFKVYDHISYNRRGEKRKYLVCVY